MKKISFFLIIALTVFYALPTFANEDPKNSAYISSEINPSEQEVAIVLTARLDEISKMDRTNMTRKERRALRSEVNAIEAKLAASSGVYLSVGALLLVIILLVILL